MALHVGDASCSSAANSQIGQFARRPASKQYANSGKTTHDDACALLAKLQECRIAAVQYNQQKVQAGGAYLKISAPEVLLGHSRTVSSEELPPPTRCNGHDTLMSCTKWLPGSSTILSPGLQQTQLCRPAESHVPVSMQDHVKPKKDEKKPD